MNGQSLYQHVPYKQINSKLQQQIEMITLFIAPVSLFSQTSCRHQAVKAFPQFS